MTSTQVRPDAVETALRDLVDRGVLTPGQAAEVRSALAHAAGQARPARWWAEVAGYVGGVLMLGGASLLLATAWDRLTDPVRAALLGAIALALIGAGILIGHGPRAVHGLTRAGAPARRRVVGVLFALASGVAAGAAAVLADGHEALAAGAVGLLVAGAGYAVLRTAPGLLASGLASLILVAAAMDELEATGPTAMGVALLLLGVAWAALAATGVATPRAVGLGVGAVLGIIGAQQPLGEDGRQGWAYALTLGVALGCFALYRWQREAVLLVAGVVGIAIAAPEAVWDWTNGAASGAVILLVAGGALIAASAVGLGLWRTAPDRRRGTPD
jgi:hypothetical protein